MKMSKEIGCPVFNGLYMLLYQGAEAFKLWTGKEMPIDKIKANGYDVTTPIIISNTEQFAKVKACEDKVVTKESKLLSVQ